MDYNTSSPAPAAGQIPHEVSRRLRLESINRGSSLASTRATLSLPSPAPFHYIAIFHCDLLIPLVVQLKQNGVSSKQSLSFQLAIWGQILFYILAILQFWHRKATLPFGSNTTVRFDAVQLCRGLLEFPSGNLSLEQLVKLVIRPTARLPSAHCLRRRDRPTSGIVK